MCMLFIVFIISFCLVFFGPCEKEEFNQRRSFMCIYVWVDGIVSFVGDTLERSLILQYLSCHRINAVQSLIYAARILLCLSMYRSLWLP